MEVGHDAGEPSCRLCGNSDRGKMLHLSSTYSITGKTDLIFNLLDSISALLKLENEEENLLSKHACLSCFNIAVDVQAFIDSSINFQKSILSQIEQEKKFAEKPDITLTHKQFGSQRKGSEVIAFDIADAEVEPIVKYSDIRKSSYRETSCITQRSNDSTAANTPNLENSSSTRSTSPETCSTDVSLPLLENKCQRNSENDAISTIERESDEKHSVVNSSKSEDEKETKCQEDVNSNKKCPICSKIFQRQSQMKSHLASHSGTRPFECTICHTKFKYRRNLVEHSSIHNDIPSFICSVCGLTFKQRSNLLKHERIHREKDKHSYQCTMCGNRYTQSSHLRTHIRNTHENKKGHKCHLCDTVVLCQSSLKRHISTVHADTSKFVCPHCNKGFNNSQNYQGHLRRHSGERPYSCSVCAKTFTTTKAVSRHRLIHQGIKKHKCTHCSKAFYELCDLKKHTKRHLKRIKKAANKSQESATNSTTQVVTGINSLNLMVLTESLLFSEPQQLLETSASNVTEILLPDGKLSAAKGVTAEPLLDPGMIQNEPTNLQQSTVSLSKISNILRPGEEVLSSSLLPTEPVLSAAQNVENVTMLAESGVLPSETKTGVPAPIDSSGVLQPADIGVEEVLRHSENRGVGIETQESSQCGSVTETPTMVVLSSATHSEYLSVTKQETHAGNTDLDGTRHQQGERVLSHATW